jgi:nitroreductase/FMN reductase [NAD(P)H]
MTDALSELRNTLGFRFSDAPPVAGEFAGLETLARLAGRGSQRHFTEAPVDADLLRLLAAVALAAPTKSDLQQRDIVCIEWWAPFVVFLRYFALLLSEFE